MNKKIEISMKNGNFKPTMFKVDDYHKIMHYLKTKCQDIDMKLCEGCARSKISDKNGNEYFIFKRRTTIEQAVSLVEKIREINKSVTNA